MNERRIHIVRTLQNGFAFGTQAFLPVLIACVLVLGIATAIKIWGIFLAPVATIAVPATDPASLAFIGHTLVFQLINFLLLTPVAVVAYRAFFGQPPYFSAGIGVDDLKVLGARLISDGAPNLVIVAGILLSGILTYLLLFYGQLTGVNTSGFVQTFLNGGDLSGYRQSFTLLMTLSVMTVLMATVILAIWIFCRLVTVVPHVLLTGGYHIGENWRATAGHVGPILLTMLALIAGYAIPLTLVDGTVLSLVPDGLAAHMQIASGTWPEFWPEPDIYYGLIAAAYWQTITLFVMLCTVGVTGEIFIALFPDLKPIPHVPEE